jgi:hypothetical protein
MVHYSNENQKTVITRIAAYFCLKLNFNKTQTQPPWPQSSSELYRLSDHCLSAKLVPTFTDRGCLMVSAPDLHSCILRFLDGSCCYLFEVAPQLYSWGWVDPIPDPLLPRKSGSSENWTGVWNSMTITVESVVQSWIVGRLKSHEEKLPGIGLTSSVVFNIQDVSSHICHVQSKQVLRIQQSQQVPCC